MCPCKARNGHIEVGFYLRTFIRRNHHCKVPWLLLVWKAQTALLQVKNMIVANTAVYQSNIFAVADNNGYNSTYNNITVIPDPRGIPGTLASQPPLFSTNADGIHVTSVSHLTQTEELSARTGSLPSSFLLRLSLSLQQASVFVSSIRLYDSVTPMAEEGMFPL